MKIDRYKPKVNTFHYNSKEDYEDYQNEFNIHITPLRITYPTNQENSCTLGIRLDFTMVFENFVVSGSLGQVSLFKDRKIESQEDLTKEELDQLLSPLFELVQRLTYEVSEIALDEPGITIQFDQVNQQKIEVNGEEG